MANPSAQRHHRLQVFVADCMTVKLWLSVGGINSDFTAHILSTALKKRILCGLVSGGGVAGIAAVFSAAQTAVKMKDAG